ncbi:TIGR02679 family protein [Mesorhizobium temperatum]|uniref:TIGR02679 family protein n=1 Tax=Mesorhizobium temperatum TaxID=241416 RepID=A0A271LGX1_9HYPH|nr:TIGR02679 family protein [Mesorhizobium temperatum]PAQ06536.1 TIGR02679 family protein [Mesorhizobium temperatum]
MSDQVDPRLQRLLGGDDLASLRKRLRQRFERAPLEGAVDHIRVVGLSAEEHAALAALLGRAQRRSKSLQIDVRRVDADLRRAGIATSLRDALERLDGSILHLAGARLRQQTLWSSVIDGCSHPDLARLLLTPEGIGLVKRLARRDTVAAAELCRRAEEVLQHLPAKGITRSQLAAGVLGDAHALDNGRGAAALVLAVLRQTAMPAPDAAAPIADEDGETERKSREDVVLEAAAGAERIRETWARAGVLVNELARPALFLNLPTNGTESDRLPLGEPAYASLRSLLRSPPRWDVAGRNVYVCENPNLLAIAADRWGAGCAPLVCTEGMPAAAQRCLLAQLALAGARLRYHGDFDWPGLRIGNQVMREHGAEPWRFGAADYIAAVRTAPGLAHPLGGKVAEASWDGALAPAMREHCVAIAEEALAASLLPDLDDR